MPNFHINRKIAIIAIITIILVVAIVVVWYIRESNLSSKDSMGDQTAVDITDYPEEIKTEIEIPFMVVVDFKNNKAKDTVEARYSAERDTTKVYKNDKFIGESPLIYPDNTSMLEFSPESMLESTVEDIDIEQYKSDIKNVYNIPIKKVECYIANLIKNSNYELLRKVNTITYCEAYLRIPDGAIVRMLITSDRMVMVTLSKDELKPILDYFNMESEE